MLPPFMDKPGACNITLAHITFTHIALTHWLNCPTATPHYRKGKEIIGKGGKSASTQGCCTKGRNDRH